MKKIFTSVLMLLFATSIAFAQEAEPLLQFVNSEGNVVADGTTVNVTEGETDVFGDIQFPTGISVQNISGDEIYVGISYNVTKLDNGSFQICFPLNCMNISNTGEGKTPQGKMATDEKKSLMAEWLPAENGFGTCSVELQANVYTYNAITKEYKLDEEGPKITVNMIYKDPASVQNLENTVHEKARYNNVGQAVNGEQHGVNIVLFENGKTVKVINK